MPDELLTPPPLPERDLDILRLLEPRLTSFECHLRHLGDGRYDVVDDASGSVLGEVVEDLHEFARSNGVNQKVDSQPEQ